MRKGYVLLLAAAALLVLLAGLGLLNGLWGQKNGPAAATPTQTAIPAALGGLPRVTREWPRPIGCTAWTWA
jgi:hypothetical protein